MASIGKASISTTYSTYVCVEVGGEEVVLPRVQDVEIKDEKITIKAFVMREKDYEKLLESIKNSDYPVRFYLRDTLTKETVLGKDMFIANDGKISGLQGGMEEDGSHNVFTVDLTFFYKVSAEDLVYLPNKIKSIYEIGSIMPQEHVYLTNIMFPPSDKEIKEAMGEWETL